MVLSHSDAELVSSCVPDPRPREPGLRQSEDGGETVTLRAREGGELQAQRMQALLGCKVSSFSAGRTQWG